MPYNQAASVLRTLVHSRTHFIAAKDLCDALRLPLEQCHEVLDKFVDEGLLMKTVDEHGRIYYWLTNKLNQR